MTTVSVKQRYNCCTIGNALPAGEDSTILVLVLVFRFLTFSELLLVGRVSRLWQRASTHPSLWELMDLSDYRLDSDVREGERGRERESG